MTGFIGVDVLVAHPLSDLGPLRTALAAATGVPVERVACICQIDDYPSPDDAGVVCVVTRGTGEFPTLLSVDAREGHGQEPVSFVARVAAALQAPCLFGTEDPNPFAMYRVEAGQPIRRVFLDPQAESAGEYTLAIESEEGQP